MESLTTTQDVYHFMDQIAPFSTQMSFDNAGFLVGDSNAPVRSLLVSLDITDAVIQEAIHKKCQLIITHHPVIFTPLKAVTTQTTTGRHVIKLLQHNIGVLSAHTNLDAVMGGVNCHLAQKLQLQNITLLQQDGVDPQGNPYGIGRIGTPHASALSGTDYAQFVKTALQSHSVRVVDGGKPVARIAVGGGSCGSMLAHVAESGCDTFVTGDVKYDVFLEAKERGITLIDGGHFPTEQVICQPLVEQLSQQFPDLSIFLSNIHEEVYRGL